jgi:FAD/FMN-containing dehydrogenase
MSDYQPDRDLFEALQKSIGGEVRFDPLTRQLYSTDASSYRVVPQGVVIPRHADDVSAVIELAARHNTSVTARGGGSSLAGQAVGAGLALDYSRHFDRILEINPTEKWARVEAGVVLNQLNTALRPHSLMVGPDPSSAPVATLGGMAANNATGVHSIRYGLMVDHVQAAAVILADGSRVEFGPKTPAQVALLAQQNTLEGRLYRDIPALLDRYQADITTRYPHTWRNVAGYNLNRLLDQPHPESGRTPGPHPPADFTF